MSRRQTTVPRGRRRKEADLRPHAKNPPSHVGGWTVRAALPSDARVIARFNRAMAFETEARQLSPQRVLHGVRALLADAAKGRYFVAECDSEVIGQTLITYEWSDWRNGNFWWIQSVYVAPAHRGRGVFKALHHHIHQLARRQNDVCGLRLYVDCHNAQAKEVYARLGMTRTDYELWEEDFRRQRG